MPKNGAGAPDDPAATVKPKRRRAPKKHALVAWREKNGLSRRAFARKIKVATPTTVRRYEFGEQMPRRDVMAKIKRVTGGEVNESHFY